MRTLLKELKDNNIGVCLEKDNLKIKFNGDRLPEELVARLKENKSQLIQYLSALEKEEDQPDIEALPSQPHYALSSSQYRIWVLSQTEEGNIAYNIPGAWLMEGELDVQALYAAFTMLVRRYESLRTVFREEEAGEVRQWIGAPAAAGLRIAMHDLCKEREAEGIAAGYITEEAGRPFDLAEGPLFRAGLYRIGPEKWICSFVMHHIISDGWSMHILMRQVMLLYNSYRQGITPDLPALRIHYKDFAAWQQQQLKGERLDWHRDYWLRQMEGELPVLELPTDRPRPAVKTYTGATVRRTIPADVTKKLKEAVHRQDASLFMGLLAVVNVLMYRYTGQRDLVLGSLIAGRDHVELDEQIGFFINTLALRCRLDDEWTFQRLLDEVKEVTMGAYEHQIYPFDQLIQELSFSKDRSRHPLFDVMVVLQNTRQGQVDARETLGDLIVSEYTWGENTVSKFDLSFNFLEVGEGLEVIIEYNTDIYDRASAERTGRHFQQIMEAALRQTTTALSRLDYLSADEKQQLLYEFNDSAVSYPADRTVLDLFAAQVAAHPDQPAVVAADTTLTYRELDERSDRLARHLADVYGVGKGHLTGICMARDEWMIIAILAILKTGGAYIPIDVNLPEARKRYIITDARLQLLVVRPSYAAMQDVDIQYCVPDESLTDGMTPVEAPDAMPGPSDLAYVIYTSGSTGEPKGVMVEHGGIANTVHAQQTLFKVKPGERGLQFASPSFDASVWEIFLMLASGGALYIIDDAARQEPGMLDAFLIRHHIDVITIPPICLQMMSDEAMRTVRTVITAGEASIRESVGRYLQWGEYYNAYGPTETSICATAYRMAPGDELPAEGIPIGPPIPNTTIYILDDQLELMPAGLPGEICIGGPGLARGYLHRPALTATRFIDHPWKNGQRLYRTGDVGRWLPGGDIQFTGRKDEQVKINGHRVELGEIEAVLRSCPRVTSAAAAIKKDADGGKYMAAYLTADEPLDMQDIRRCLTTQLPAYMIPHQFMQLAVLPLNNSGKVDKKALPDVSDGMTGGAGQPAYQPPADEKERCLIEVCEEMLKRKPIGLQDDLFMLGCDSIKAMRLIARLRQKGFSLTIRDVMTCPVIGDLAARMSIAVRMADQGVVTGEVIPGPVQQYFFAGDQTDLHHFNQTVLLHSRQRLSEKALRDALDAVTLHHDALRMVLRPAKNGKEDERFGQVQDIRGGDDGYTMHVYTVDDAAALAVICAQMQAEVDLQKGPLFRVALFHLPDDDKLFLAAHHLIIDGVSWRILFEDLAMAYGQAVTGGRPVLPAKTDSFQQWQQQQAVYAKSEVLARELPFWTAMAGKNVSLLPKDRPHGSNQMKDLATAVMSFPLDGPPVSGMNEILIAALTLALRTTFGMEDIAIRMEGHGREDIGTAMDVSRTIGWFTTIYPVVFTVQGAPNLDEQVRQVRQRLLEVPNKGIGYGLLRYSAGENAPTGLVIEPEITFNYLGDLGDGVETDEGQRLLEFSDLDHGHDVSPARQRDSVLDISAIAVLGKLTVSIGYSNRQYETSTITRLREALQLHIARELKKDPPLSYNQQFYFNAWTIDSVTVVSNHELNILDIPAFVQAVQQLIRRHEILRTVFVVVDGQRVQQVLPAEQVEGQVHVARRAVTEKRMGTIVRREERRRFDPSVYPLFDIRVYKLVNGKYNILLSLHHLITDGYSTGVMRSELIRYYNRITEGGRALVKPSDVQYRHYAEWQHAFVRSAEGAAQRNYWLQRLHGFDPRLGPSRSASRVTVPGAGCVRITTAIDGGLYEALDRCTRKYGLTGNTLMLGCFTLLVSRITGRKDVTLTIPVSGRDNRQSGQPDISSLIGYFVNVVFVRNKIDPDMPLHEFLRQAHTSFMNDLVNSAYPFTRLMQELPGVIPDSRLLDDLCIYNYHNYEYLRETRYEAPEEPKEDVIPMQCTLGLTVTEFDGCTQVEMVFDPDVFPIHRRQEIHRQLLDILTDISGYSFTPEKKQASMRDTSTMGRPLISKGKISQYVLLGILSGLFSFLFINFVTRVVGLIIGGEFTAIRKEYVVLFFSIILAYVWTRRALSVAIIRLSQSFFWQLRKQILTLVLNANYQQLTARKAEIDAAIVSDVHILTQASMSIIEFFTSLILAFSILVYLACISWVLFAITLGVAAIGVLVYYFGSQYNNRDLESARTLETTFIGHFNDVLNGFKEIYMEPRKGRAIFEQRIVPVAGKSLSSNLSAFTGFLNNQLTGQVLFYVLISSVLLFFSIILDIKAGDTVRFAFALLYLLSSIENIMVLLPGIMRAKVASQHLVNLRKDLERVRYSNPVAATSIRLQEFETLQVEGLQFRYGYTDNAFSIGPAYLEIASGDIVFIYGGNGSGKTTFVHTLLGLREPTAGQRYLNGVPVGKDNYAWYRTAFAAVFSDFFLFDGLVGLDDPDIEKWNYYLGLFELDGKVSIENGRFSTTDLSTGQRKRLALIAALLEEKPILVLDEWAADQDPYFRKKFYTEILPLLKERGFTILAITHDDKYYHAADKVYRMEEGRLIAEQVDMHASL